MIFKRLISAFFAAVLALPVAAAERGPVWDLGTRPADPEWSATGYAIAQGAVRPRAKSADETPAESEALDVAWRAGIETYRDRVSHMVLGMNLADEAERMEHCRAMAALVSPRFRHTEGRENRNGDGSGGWAIRDKSALERACAARAFRLDGFFAEVVRSEPITSDLVQVTFCYWHNQRNDPLVPGKWDLPNGTRATPRVSVETIMRTGPGQPWLIVLHKALDVSRTMVVEGCDSRAG